ncbi:hypothetical protein J6590_059320 [Homalodisca vitripennis]|nr:hypothetical protein J6590_059320 [Homalodisca vitripennis]
MDLEYLVDASGKIALNLQACKVLQAFAIPDFEASTSCLVSTLVVSEDGGSSTELRIVPFLSGGNAFSTNTNPSLTRMSVVDPRARGPASSPV